MYYVVGPVLALLISLKYTHQQNQEHQKEYEALVSKVELLRRRHEQIDKEMLQKVMTTVLPIAKAVNKLNQEVGL